MSRSVFAGETCVEPADIEARIYKGFKEDMTKVIVFVTYEGPLFPAGGVAAVMGKLPSAVEAAAKLPVVVLTPFHRESKKIAAREKRLLSSVEVPFEAKPVGVEILHSKIDCPWYFLKPKDESAARSPFFGGKSHPYDVPGETLLRDSLFFGAAVVQALPAIATDLGLVLDDIEWNLIPQDWEAATAALAFASQNRCRGRIHLTLHNSYDDFARDSDFERVGVNPLSCPGDTILHRALSLVEPPAFTVSEQFAADFSGDLLQREVMAPHLQRVFHSRPPLGVDNGPFKPLAVDEAHLRAAAVGDFAALSAWKGGNRRAALKALDAHKPAEAEPVWGDKSAFRRGDSPCFVMAGRDDPRQKGYDVAVAAIEGYLAAHHGEPDCAQFLFFPIPGDEGLAGLGFLRDLAFRFPADVLAFPFIWVAGFTAALQGASYGLMPSLYEPFGMANEFYLAGGCVGIARATGGNLEQIVPIRAGASYSEAVRVRANPYHLMSTQPTGILFREADNIATASADWAGINNASYLRSGESRVAQRREFGVFRAMADELRVALGDGIRFYREQPALYYRMLAEGVAHIQRTFSWYRAGQEYARKVGSEAADDATLPAVSADKDSPIATKQPDRIEWQESRPDGLFLMVALWKGSEWEFFEREAWQVRWYPVAATSVLVGKAEELHGRESRRVPMG